jgi:hypothetical protein
MSLDRRTLTQLVEMAAESSEYPYPRKAKATPEVLKEASKFEKDLERALKEWVKKNPLAADYDASDLMDDEGAYNVLMTLRGEGVGIWDGRWDQYFKNSREIKVLEAHLKRKVGKYADDTGGGSLNMAFDNAAYDTCGGEEMDEAYSSAPSTDETKPTKLGGPNAPALDTLPPDAGTTYSDDDEECEECEEEECACGPKAKAMVRVIAELVKRGQEDLAEELLSLSAKTPVYSKVNIPTTEKLDSGELRSLLSAILDALPMYARRATPDEKAVIKKVVLEPF